MKRACGSVGKTIGCGGRTPLHAICSVVQIGLPGLALATILVMSPTTLMSVLTGGPPACAPLGIGYTSTPWMSHAAAYDRTAATVSGSSGLPGLGPRRRGASMIATG